MPNAHPRRRNYNIPGHAHELTFSCYQRFPFLKAERTCQWLADAIDAARSKRHFKLWAYVFMPEHVHLIVRPESNEYDIATIRSAIKHPVAREALAWMREHAPHCLPRVTRKRGQRTERLFWQSGGGYDRNITDPKTLAAMIGYLHLNPVRRSLVDRPEDWHWSSAAQFAGAEGSPLRVDSIPAEGVWA